MLNAGKPMNPLRFYPIVEKIQYGLPIPSKSPRLEDLRLMLSETTKIESDELNRLTVQRKETEEIKEEDRTRFMLKYDSGITHMAEGACKTLEDRIKPCDKFGWAGQFAYDGHLEENGIKRTHDNPFYSPRPDECDFRIDFNGKENRIEIKTTQPPKSHKECRVYKYRMFEDRTRWDCWHRPDYVIAIKCMDDSMTKFKLYGWLTWRDVEKYGDYQEYSEGGRWGIPLDSPRIKDYSTLLDKMKKNTARTSLTNV